MNGRILLTAEHFIHALYDTAKIYLLQSSNQVAEQRCDLFISSDHQEDRPLKYVRKEIGNS